VEGAAAPAPVTKLLVIKCPVQESFTRSQPEDEEENLFFFQNPPWHVPKKT
jgi:hypothetical protein